MTSAPQGRCAYLDADLHDPAAILHSPQVRETLDLTQPVAVTFGSILMLLPDDADPWEKVATLMHAVPAGSYVVVSHPTADFNPAAMAEVIDLTGASGFTFVPRQYDDVERFFHGCQFIEPGLVPVLDWRADHGPVVVTFRPV